MLKSGRIAVLLASCLGFGVLVMGCFPVPSIEPQEAVNPVGTTHTVTGTITEGEIPDLPDICDILPESCEQLQASTTQLSDNVFFEVIAGPNAGRHSDGDCGDGNDPCNIDGEGSISWTYRGTGGPGLDTIQFCPLFGASIEESKALLANLISTVAREAGVSEAELLKRANLQNGSDKMAEVDPGCVGATKEWFLEPSRPNIGAGLSGLFAGQPTALPTAPAPAAVAPASNPTIRPPSTGDAALR